MQILYIIGNGFDRNLGLRTSYKHFYQFYNTQNASGENVQVLKEKIRKDIEDWSDLEFAFGEHTQYLKSTPAFDEVYLDIVTNLADYLSAEEKKISSLNADSQKFFHYLINPEEHLLPTDQSKLLRFRDQWRKHQWNLSIFTFNYTSTIEWLCNNEFENRAIGHHDNNVLVNLESVKHIHGYLNREMVLGVNDISQIKNKAFHDNTEVLESLVKSDCNEANRNGIDQVFNDKISRANLICIFGSSLGLTDKRWWELIGQRLLDNCRLMIFMRGGKINQRSLQYLRRIEREKRQFFLDRTNLSKEEQEEVRDKIFICVNSKIFSEIVP